MSTAKRGESVLFTPSVSRNKSFENPKEDYVAIVTQVYANSVDLCVVGENEFKTCQNVQHHSLSPTGRSRYAFFDHDAERSE